MHSNIKRADGSNIVTLGAPAEDKTSTKRLK